jgi:hypothetical protein
VIEPAGRAIRTCPGCGARLPVDPDLLGDAEQLATCTRCGTYFQLDQGGVVDAECADPFARATALRLSPEPVAPPFEVPDDLPPLEPDSDPDFALAPERRRPGPLAILSCMLLVVALLAQAAWHYRIELLQRVPRLATLCLAWQCPAAVIAAPAQFRVVARDLRAAPQATGALRLNLRLRNDAAFAQPYPVIQLALLDNRGHVVQRGHLQPADYLPATPAANATVASGASLGIAVDIADPGPRASGFVVDFF